MTEAQRNYLADLAAKKGVRLKDTENVSVAWASEKIEELKALPDVEFSDISDVEKNTVNKYINNILQGLSLWTFQR